MRGAGPREPSTWRADAGTSLATRWPGTEGGGGRPGRAPAPKGTRIRKRKGGRRRGSAAGSTTQCHPTVPEGAPPRSVGACASATGCDDHVTSKTTRRAARCFLLSRPPLPGYPRQSGPCRHEPPWAADPPRPPPPRRRYPAQGCYRGTACRLSHTAVPLRASHGGRGGECPNAPVANGREGGGGASWTGGGPTGPTTPCHTAVGGGSTRGASFQPLAVSLQPAQPSWYTAPQPMAGAA